MPETVFLKLGGSLLTDKTQPQALRVGILQRLAAEVAEALRLAGDCGSDQVGIRLLIGHGSGSFGHVAASKHGTRAGVHSLEEWRGYAETARAAAQLHRFVVDALWNAGVPVLGVQPSASARCVDGELQALDERPLRAALVHGLVPVVYGDVALDDRRGGTIISTEQIFAWLAGRLAPQRIVLAGEVAGVLTADPASGVVGEVIPVITPATMAELRQVLGGSRGVDVTGGMLAKVAAMLALVTSTPSLSYVHIVSGLTPGLLRDALIDRCSAGTRIRRG